MPTPPATKIRTVLFDLDGTLADTAPDLAFALNAVLQEEGRPAEPFAAIRPHVSHGATALIRFGFKIAQEHEDFIRLRQRLLDVYAANIARETQLFPGMQSVLDTLEEMGLNWGVVTNKPAFLTEPLLEKLGVRRRAVTVVSGDTTVKRKPDPEPMFYACREAGSGATQCLYIGDAQRDIEAGRQAGMRTLVALFGYLDQQDQPETWGADGLIRRPHEILSWVTEREEP